MFCDHQGDIGKRPEENHVCLLPVPDFFADVCTQRAATRDVPLR